MAAPRRAEAGVAVVGLAPVPVVLGFALAHIGTALLYRPPVPLQPMMAVAGSATGLARVAVLRALRRRT